MRKLEHHRQPLASPARFALRMGGFATAALAVVSFALGLGMAGYHRFEHLSWLDSFLNASMILSGMGQVDPLRTPEGKLFAGLYALLCGLVFLGVAGLLFTPILHRLLHRFHVPDEAEG